MAAQPVARFRPHGVRWAQVVAFRLRRGPLLAYNVAATAYHANDTREDRP